jgi:formylglycine-generating enzyme required for sulfatase activity
VNQGKYFMDKIGHIRSILGVTLVVFCTSLSHAKARSSVVELLPQSQPSLALTTTNKIGMRFILVSPGQFQMGSPLSEQGRKTHEGPQRRVRLSKPYYLGKYEVTQREWIQLMGSNPSRFKACGLDCPVDSVSWDDAQSFIKKLNTMEGGSFYALPSEAQWEYAARAGSHQAFGFGSQGKALGDYGWYDSNSEGTAKVGQKKPNAWGLHDMHGNVYEWVQNRYQPSYYTRAASQDPLGPSQGSKRVLRGGCWYSDPANSRSAARAFKSPQDKNGYQGFRIIKKAQIQP